jgi:hypothetical protein
MIKNNELNDLILWTTVTGLSGGICYLGLNDVYHIYVRKDRFYSTPWNFHSLWNRGVLFGLSVGIMHYYLKEPVLYRLCKSITM